MPGLQRAVFFFEEDAMISAHAKPLMLEELHARPILFWEVRAALARGVERFFVVSPPRFESAARDCFPAGTDAVISEQHEALMRFLDTEEEVLVLPRAGVPMEAAGVGFAYAAPGRTLREVWQIRMTNQIQDATLIPGWVPVFGKETIAELEPVFNEIM